MYEVGEGTSSDCIILNTLPNSECSPTPITTPYRKGRGTAHVRT